MIDCHIHLERGPYTIGWLNTFIDTAIDRGMDEIYILEHSHRFIEFETMYEPICRYSEYQNAWFKRNRTDLSLKNYMEFIKEAKLISYPITVKFGLEVCYFEEYEELIHDVLASYPFDFITGSVHWVDGFGFDHRKECWKNIDVDKVYKRYYEIMEKLIKSNLFTGLAHPDSIKAFGHKSSYDLMDTYSKIADLLIEHNMYAEHSGGLYLNYSKENELGMNRMMLKTLLHKGVTILTASDAHNPKDVGANIFDLQHSIINS